MKIGDIVQLKSGGPKMTISEIVRRPNNQWVKDIREQVLIDQFPEYVECKWFEGNDLRSGRFGEDAIKLVG